MSKGAGAVLFSCPQSRLSHTHTFRVRPTTLPRRGIPLSQVLRLVSGRVSSLRDIFSLLSLTTTCQKTGYVTSYPTHPQGQLTHISATRGVSSTLLPRSGPSHSPGRCSWLRERSSSLPSWRRERQAGRLVRAHFPHLHHHTTDKEGSTSKASLMPSGPSGQAHQRCCLRGQFYCPNQERHRDQSQKHCNW